MRREFFVLLFILILSILIPACGGGTTPATSNNGNTAKENSNNPLETTKLKREETVNNAPTLSPVYKAYCEAWVKNDEAALRKIYSSDTIASFEKEMKETREKSLLKYLEDDRVSGTPCEVTNEQINGDTATAWVVVNRYPKGLKVVFAKEKGEWKLTNKVPDIDSVTKSASNSNTVSNTAK